MFCCLLEQRIHEPVGVERLDILGFLGDLGTGLLYVVARSMDWGQGAVHRDTADYGTKFIIVAGLLNIVSAVDAYHIASGKKQ